MFRKSKKKEDEATRAKKQKLQQPQPPELKDIQWIVQEIKKGKNCKGLSQRIRENRGLLVTSCNLPVIFVEEDRYNFFHLATRYDNPMILAKSLSMLSSDSNFIQTGPNGASANVELRFLHILDRYLHTPCHLFGDTPLHLAAKFLAVNCVLVLVTHPLIHKTLKNHKGKTPFEVIGEGVNPRLKDFDFRKRLIQNLLANYFFLPFWKDSSGTGQIAVGEKATIQDLGNCVPYCIIPFCPKLDMKYLAPCSDSVLPQISSAPKANVTWIISSVVGPMTEQQAYQLKTALKLTAGRAVKFIANKSLSTHQILREKFPSGKNIVPEDLSGASTCVNSETSTLLSPHLTSSANSRFYRTLLSYLWSPKPKYSLLTPSQSDVNVRLCDPKGIEIIAKKYAETLGVHFKEISMSNSDGPK